MTDAYEAAMTPENQPKRTGDRVIFGEVVIVDVWYCRLVKGSGKVPWAEATDDIDDRRIAINITVDPLRGNFMLTQDCVDFAVEWKDHTLPSLRALGVDLRALQGKYVQVKKVQTGETYVSKKDQSTKNKTALEFVAIYPDREACEAAANAFFGSRRVQLDEVDVPLSPAANQSQLTDLDNIERKFVLEALPFLWKQSGEVVDTFVSMIEGNPVWSKYFNRNSPEIAALTNKAA